MELLIALDLLLYDLYCLSLYLLFYLLLSPLQNKTPISLILSTAIGCIYVL